MALEKIDELKQRIREALRGDEFQRVAVGLSGEGLSKAVAKLLKKNDIRVSLISVAPATEAALADYAAVWTTRPSGKSETSWFSVKSARR